MEVIELDGTELGALIRGLDLLIGQDVVEFANGNDSVSQSDIDYKQKLYLRLCKIDTSILTLNPGRYILFFVPDQHQTKD